MDNQNQNTIGKNNYYRNKYPDGICCVLDVDKKIGPNRMAWQWVETLVEIRGTLADIRATTK